TATSTPRSWPRRGGVDSASTRWTSPCSGRSSPPTPASDRRSPTASRDARGGTVGGVTRLGAMFAITATAIDRDDPLSGLTLGDHPDPSPPDGWEVVEVRAASLNHHDLWSLRGVGMAEERLPIVLGCDAAG